MKASALTAWHDIGSIGPGPRATCCAFLANYGIEAVHVSEIGMADTEDVQILEAARESGRLCVTLDHDFHTHLAIAGQGHPSVILLRVEGLGAEEQAELNRAICVQCERALLDGAAISADSSSIRIRRLPLK
jgi:predicted nuclease of predicted toxin-antitoxin system